jgi:hypothetical protein
MTLSSQKNYNGTGPVTAFSTVIQGYPTFDGVTRTYKFSDQLIENANTITERFGGFSLRAARDSSSDVSVDFSGDGPFSAPPGKADVFFAIDRAKSDKFEFKLDGFRTRNASGILFRQNSTNRYVPNGAPWTVGGSFSLSTFEKGNDTILPNGIGARDVYNTTLVDRGKVYVNPGLGLDAVIGGYGQDYFGSRGKAGLNSLVDIQTPFSSKTSGSKFYVGGSYDDVLDGGEDEDYLIGDRFNGYELYLPEKALVNIPDNWKTQVDALLRYQRDGFSDGSGAGRELLANIPKVFAGSNQYPLWIPGRDVIRGYEGNDIIFGDDNTMDANLYQIKGIKDLYMQTPQDVTKAGGLPREQDKFNRKLKLGADFIDAGEGNDQIYAGIGADAIIGGEGSDVISTGVQIVAPGYSPFYGPKVAFGGDARFISSKNQWDSITNPSPDLFILGGLVDSEDKIQSINSGQLDTSVTARKTVAEKLDKFEKAWNIAGQVVENIPVAGSIVKTIVDKVVTLLKLQDPESVPLGKPPNAIDALTIIRDFDSTDLLSFTVAKGETVEYKTTSFTAAINKSENPLWANIGTTRGVLIQTSIDAGTKYDRVFISGAKTRDLFVRDTINNDGSIAVTLAGSDYQMIREGRDGNEGRNPLLFKPLESF